MSCHCIAVAKYADTERFYDQPEGTASTVKGPVTRALLSGAVFGFVWRYLAMADWQ